MAPGRDAIDPRRYGGRMDVERADDNGSPGSRFHGIRTRGLQYRPSRTGLYPYGWSLGRPFPDDHGSPLTLPPSRLSSARDAWAIGWPARFPSLGVSR